MYNIFNTSHLKFFGFIIKDENYFILLYDLVCPARSAWDLHKVWPKGELHWVDDPGHLTKEVGIVHELITATDKFKEL
jgi:hypothetical protein